MKAIKFYGIGGQGVVTAGKIFSIAVALFENKYAITVPAYGHERRGAPVFTDVVMNNEPILMNCFVYHPDMVVVFDPNVINRGINIGNGINPDTVLVVNTEDMEKIEKCKQRYGFKKVFYVDATAIALEQLGSTIPNATMLGALAKSDIVTVEAIEKAIIYFFGVNAGEINAKAARRSYDKTKEN